MFLVHLGIIVKDDRMAVVAGFEHAELGAFDLAGHLERGRSITFRAHWNDFKRGNGRRLARLFGELHRGSSIILISEQVANA